MFDPPTRKAVQDFFKNSAAEFKGKEDQQRLAYHYLNPALSTSSRLFNELNRDNPLLSRFLVDSSKLVTALAQKRDDLSALIANANTTFRALGDEKVALADAISRLPGFMRQANTTFVDLRSALDATDPLVNASKPVAKKLGPFLRELRPLARDARPTVRDLSRIVGQPGPDNDLNDLQHTFPPLKSAALDTKSRSIDFGTGPKNVGKVRGSFPETAQALKDSAPIIGFGRPYTVDFNGWADDFSTTGSYDALGGFSRAFTVVNAFDATGNAAGFVPLDRPAREPPRRPLASASTSAAPAPPRSPRPTGRTCGAPARCRRWTASSRPARRGRSSDPPAHIDRLRAVRLRRRGRDERRGRQEQRERQDREDRLRQRVRPHRGRRPARRRRDRRQHRDLRRLEGPRVPARPPQPASRRGPARS